MQATWCVYRAIGFQPQSSPHSFTHPLCSAFLGSLTLRPPRRHNAIYIQHYKVIVACNAAACRKLRVSYHIRTERRQRRSKNRRQENGKHSIAICNVQRATCDTDNRHATQRTKNAKQHRGGSAAMLAMTTAMAMATGAWASFCNAAQIFQGTMQGYSNNNSCTAAETATTTITKNKNTNACIYCFCVRAAVIVVFVIVKRAHHEMR